MPSRTSGRRRAASAVPEQATILLVDDHPPNLMALEAILEPLGERLLRATSGLEAVEIAKTEELALVLLDLQMPQLDGLETAARIRQLEGHYIGPIVIVTANEPSDAVVARGHANGAVDFLYKPLDPDVLRDKVTAFIEDYKARSAPAGSDPRIVPADEPSGRLSERLVAAAPADQAETVEALVRIHSALNEDLDLDRIAQRLADETSALTSASAGAFHYLFRDTWRVAMSGDLATELEALGPGNPVMTRVFGGVGALRIDDSTSLPRMEASRRRPLVKSLLAVPVVSRSRSVVGALVLVSDQPRAFDDHDEELAAVAARHAAASLENARLFEETRDARRRAELAELELRAGEARVRLALDSAGLGTWDFNPTTGALRWDARCHALFGLDPNAPVSHSVFVKRIHEDDRERVERAIRQALDPKSDGSYDIEYRSVADSGRERWIAAKGQAFVEDGRAVRFIGIMRDITAKRVIEEERVRLLAREREARTEAESAQARAEAASRAKDEFLATVSHELRNPLNAILGWSRVLLDGDGDVGGAGQRRGLEVIARNAKAQVQLVEDILEVSRIVTGKLRLKTEPVDIRPVVEAAVDTVRAGAEAKGVGIVTTFDNVPAVIVADDDRIQQVLWNLLSNAVKFTPRGGEVEVAVHGSDTDVVVTVSDSGEGIDPEFLPFVFDRFRQADGSTTRQHGGLGLGLAIARHLVELHGGRVHAQSEGRGHGAKLTVVLPVQPQRDGMAPSTRTPPPRLATRADADGDPTRPLDGVHVLVLDDEEDMRDLIALILEHAGARVTRALNVTQAIEALSAECPHVAVSDLAMPGEDGFAFVKRVRAAESIALRDLPLVAMTAYARAEDRHRVLEAGFQRHVAKPIEPAELVAALLEMTEAIRSSRAPG